METMKLINEELPIKGRLIKVYLKNGNDFVGTYLEGGTAVGSISSEDNLYCFEDWDDGFEDIKGWNYLNKN